MPELEAAPPLVIKESWRQRLLRPRTIVAMVVGFFLVMVIACLGWYQWSLGPRDAGSTTKVRLVVESGETVEDIARKLKGYDLINSELSFRIYSILTNTKGKLQAGGYALSKDLSVADIIDHMSSGQTDQFSVFVAPGLTLKQQYDKDVIGSFAAQGFSENEISDAFSAAYTGYVLDKRPGDASLEGYLYPETFQVTATTPLSTVIQMSIDEFTKVVRENQIEEKAASRGLTLHQAITLASIVQKEVSNTEDQRQVARVFYNRLSADMALGSDVTFLYAAALQGVDPTINIDSPYNTRKYKGLPPGPIANFNLSALMAVAEPADNSYLYFVADPEGVTHYAETLEQHEANVQQFNSAAKTDYSY